MRPQTDGHAAQRRGKRQELATLGALVGIVVLGIVLTLNSGHLAAWHQGLR
jgi:hypothetical protein